MDLFGSLADVVLEMGVLANERQASILPHYKEDGSIVTSTDTEISETLMATIKKLFPEANIVSEEELSPFNEEAPYTFIIDPIDGTDVYSQGFPGWCISIGILNQKREAVGAMINAPRWGLNYQEGLFLRQDPGGPLLLNNTPFEERSWSDSLEQLAMSSYSARYLPLDRFDGKIRIFGSNILHMISPLVHPLIQGALSTPCFVWDICGAHALLTLQGYEVLYNDGTPFVYDDELLIERKSFKGVVYSGRPQFVKELIELFN